MSNPSISNITDVNKGIRKNKSTNRVGRGTGSGNGKTSGRGFKGQGSRAGFSLSAAFEGGQMPLARRVPKRGFNNKRFAEPIEDITLARIVAKFDASEEVTPEALRAKGLVDGQRTYVKVIGVVELTGAYKMKLHAISKGAREAIEKAGGTVEILPRKNPVVKNKMRPKGKKEKD